MQVLRHLLAPDAQAEAVRAAFQPGLRWKAAIISASCWGGPAVCKWLLIASMVPCVRRATPAALLPAEWIPVSLTERYRAFTTGARGTTHTEMQFIIPLGITMRYLHSHSPMRSSRLAALASFKSKDARGYTTARVLHFFRCV